MFHAKPTLIITTDGKALDQHICVDDELIRCAVQTCRIAPACFPGEKIGDLDDDDLEGMDSSRLIDLIEHLLSNAKMIK